MTALDALLRDLEAKAKKVADAAPVDFAAYVLGPGNKGIEGAPFIIKAETIRHLVAVAQAAKEYRFDNHQNCIGPIEDQCGLCQGLAALERHAFSSRVSLSDLTPEARALLEAASWWDLDRMVADGDLTNQENRLRKAAMDFAASIKRGG